MSELKVATRASALARAQTQWVCRHIESLTGHHTQEVLVSTQGDTSTADLTSFGGQGVFVTAVQESLLDGRADVAVHSLKDMPTTVDPRTRLVAVPGREDARDYVVAAGAGLHDLPDGARVATGSPRREAFLRRVRPDLRIVGIRGNVDTRVRKVVDGEVDAVVVAAAGLSRLGLQPPGFWLDADEMLPAPGQGALAIQMRADDSRAAKVAGLDDLNARAAVTAERSLLAALRAGCAAPVGAAAVVAAGIVELRAAVLSGDGSQMYECTMTGVVGDAKALGERAAEDLIGQGADRLLGDNR